MLLEAKANPTHVDYCGRNVFCSAAEVRLQGPMLYFFGTLWLSLSIASCAPLCCPKYLMLYCAWVLLSSLQVEKIGSDIFVALVSAGADINEGFVISGDTALHVAIKKNNRQTAISLLKSGANVHIRNGEGRTAIECAATGNPSVFIFADTLYLCLPLPLPPIYMFLFLCSGTAVCDKE